jgi:hypothetical protein
MRVMMFHLMPYADLDLSVKDHYRSVWVVLPNTYFDPVKGHALYNRYLDELELGAELGFDGVCVNEHHQCAYGIMPSPVVTASALSRRLRGGGDDCRLRSACIPRSLRHPAAGIRQDRNTGRH